MKKKRQTIIDPIKLLTLFVRALGIGSRFLLALLISKYISLEFQGEYTLIVSTITILIIVLGLDFYVFSNRLIVKKTKKKEIFIFKNALAFYSISYLLLFPVLWLVFNYFSLTIVPLWLFYLLIIFEHLGQEFFRVYVALNKVLFANILLFIRTGIWSFLLVIGFVFIQDFIIDIKTILYLWMLSAFVTCLLGFWFYPNVKYFFKVSIDKKWILKGLVVGSTMFLSTICLKIIEYSDRYLIALFLDKKELGIYSLYFQLSNIINVIIFTMYISFLYPEILSSVYNKSIEDLKKVQKVIKQKTLLIVCLFIVFSLIFLPYFIEYVDKPELKERTFVLYFLIISTFFLNYSFVNHFVIVGFEKEKLVFKATFFACIVNVVLNLILIPLIGIYGSAIAILTSNLILYLLKNKYAKKLLATWG